MKFFLSILCVLISWAAGAQELRDFMPQDSIKEYGAFAASFDPSRGTPRYVVGVIHAGQPQSPSREGLVFKHDPEVSGSPTARPYSGSKEDLGHSSLPSMPAAGISCSPHSTQRTAVRRSPA